MEYRLRVDMSFKDESNARDLQKYARGLISKAVTINEGKLNEEISYCDLELCGHDEGKPCVKLDREEIIGGKIVTIV